MINMNIYKEKYMIEEKCKIEFVCTKVMAGMLKRYYEFICQNDFHLPNEAFKDAPFLKEKIVRFLNLYCHLI